MAKSFLYTGGPTHPPLDKDMGCYLNDLDPGDGNRETGARAKVASRAPAPHAEGGEIRAPEMYYHLPSNT